MTRRENVLRALRRESPEKVPFEFIPSPAILETIRERYGTSDYEGFFGIPFRDIETAPSRLETDYRPFYRNLPPDALPIEWAPEWGVLGVRGSVAHFQKMLHPMADFQSPGEMDRYPFPDFDAAYRWEGVADQVRRIADQDLVSVARMQMTLFETAWYLRGLEAFLIDLATGDAFADVLLDRITDIRVAMAGRYARTGVDILMLGDDVATQLDMMIDPDLWRRTIKPRLIRVIDAARAAKPDILIFYHGDGNMSRIVPDLVRIGVDILNPVQPECMDPFELKRLYGNRLAFWGTLGTQTTLPFGTPDEVRETCRRLIRDIGQGGGLVLAPTHMVEPDVPMENLVAFLETVMG